MLGRQRLRNSFEIKRTETNRTELKHRSVLCSFPSALPSPMDSTTDHSADPNSTPRNISMSFSYPCSPRAALPLSASAAGGGRRRRMIAKGMQHTLSRPRCS
ncbi:hypothetical protein HPP92_000312 [Vanilla planifolia]|uniref:Uncharacterized protein n=1 Tax=Vanilla planifolia TaxID=51239 RepID=A0A835RX87_VANPL|nr:hypothetical protein HPP92_000312 [Vanilla planifolia]